MIHQPIIYSIYVTSVRDTCPLFIWYSTFSIICGHLCIPWIQCRLAVDLDWLCVCVRHSMCCVCVCSVAGRCWWLQVNKHHRGLNRQSMLGSCKVLVEMINVLAVPEEPLPPLLCLICCESTFVRVLVGRIIWEEEVGGCLMTTPSLLSHGCLARSLSADWGVWETKCTVSPLWVVRDFLMMTLADNYPSEQREDDPMPSLHHWLPHPSCSVQPISATLYSLSSAFALSGPLPSCWNAQCLHAWLCSASAYWNISFIRVCSEKCPYIKKNIYIYCCS